MTENLNSKLLRNMKVLMASVAAMLWLALMTAEPTVADSNDVIELEVWKTPTCGCCKAWVSYLEERGFKVKANDVADVTPIKQALGLTDARLYSCHTAKVGKYIVEGHVPESDIRRMLKEQPDIAGLTAPGMPMMSPGMNSIEPRDYDVIAFDKDQKPTVYSRY